MNRPVVNEASLPNRATHEAGLPNRTTDEADLPLIVIDARMITGVPHGIGRYVETLALGLSELDREKPLSFRPVFLVSPGFRPESSSAFAAFERVECSAPFLSPREWIEVPRALKRLRAKLFHSTSFASFPGLSIPYLQTIHDLNHLQFGSFAQKLYYKKLLKPFASKARAVFSVSQAAAREIERWLDREVAVAPNAFSESELRLGTSPLPPNESGFVAVLNGKKHKNLVYLIDAYSKARRKSGAGFPKLVVTVPHREAWDAQGIQGVNGLASGALNALVSGARALFSPSAYEGFGRPPVEALLLGTPVYASDIPPHREALEPYLGIGAKLLPLGEQFQWVNAFLQSARSNDRVDPVVRKSLLDRFSTRSLGSVMARAYEEGARA